MKRKRTRPAHVFFWMVLLTLSSNLLMAQFRGAGPPVVSPEVTDDGKVTFRIRAPKAEAVKLGGTDIPGLRQDADMTRDDQGIWSKTLGPLTPGAYFTAPAASRINRQARSTWRASVWAWPIDIRSTS